MSVSSILSTRSTGWKFDVRLATLMDSIFAIGFGLGLRFVVDAVSDHDFKITGTLVGLWEGVIMLHFTKKMPKSSDPFIAYAVRLFVDFLCTESVTRLVLVLVWTALGMVLADVTPALWYEVGLRRVWRRFRRDIYTMSQRIPTVAFFPPTRTVRFSPSREPSIITDADADAISPPSVITTEQTPTTNTVPTTTAPAAREILRRRVPGYFPADVSDTETELGSVRLGPSPGERTSRRLSVFPGIHDFEEESVSSQNDLDEGNLSSISSTSTERPEASSTIIDASIIPDMYAEEEALVDVVAGPVKDEEEMKTPKQSSAPYMPPTPSDSAMHIFRRQPSEDPLIVRPPLEFMPQIPDFLDEANTEDWEKIQRQEATEEKPPTPPAKDAMYKLKAPIIHAPVPPQPQLQRSSTPSPEDETKGWDMLDSQFITNPNDNNKATSNDHQVQTYDDDDDMYADDAPAPEYTTFPALGESSATELPPLHTTDFTSGILEPDNVRTNPWVGVEEKKRMDEESERQQREVEEAARKQQEEEDALKKKQEEEDAAEARRLEEEKLKEKKAQEKAERLKKEAEDDAIRKKKREEDEAAERKRKEEAAAAAEQKRKEDEEAEERKRQEEEKQKEREEAEQMKREEAERTKREKKVAKERKLVEAAEANHLKEEEEEKKRQEMVVQRKRKASEAAEGREKARQEAEKKRLEEEAEAAATAASLAQALAEKEERKKEEEALATRLKEQQAAELKVTKDKEAAEARRMKEEAELKATKAKEETEARRMKEEAELKATKAKEEAEAQRMKDEAEKATKAKEVAEAQRVKEEAEARAAPVTNSSQEQDKQIDLPTDELDAEFNNYQQDHGQTTGPLSPAEPGQFVVPIAETFDEESVISEASARQDSVRDRLGKLLLLRAQMAEVGNQIADLKDQLQSADGESSAQQEQELRQREKTMRKMQRKEKMKHDEGLTEMPFFLNALGDDDKSIYLENLTPRNAETKIEEKLEQLLKPETKSITLMIHAGRGKPGAKIKINVRNMLIRYNLLPYTSNDKSSDRISHIRISEEDFAQWLLDYRVKVTKVDEAEEEHWSYVH